jgi:lipopolysaccharide transport system permease protein
MYFTPVIYPRAILPASYDWVWQLNPMTHLVDAFRLPIYEHQRPSLPELAIVALVGLASFTCGWWLFTSSADDLARRG